MTTDRSPEPVTQQETLTNTQGPTAFWSAEADTPNSLCVTFNHQTLTPACWDSDSTMQTQFLSHQHIERLYLKVHGLHILISAVYSSQQLTFLSHTEK